MRFFSLLLCTGLSAASLVKREADAEASPVAEAEAEGDPSGYQRHGGYHSAPVCTLTPVKECHPRQVETPRKVCQHVVDIHEDTVVTENCQELVTTTCTQTSQVAHHTSAVVDHGSRLVEEGVPQPIAHPAPHHAAPHHAAPHHGGYNKREAEADAEAEANAEAEADPYYSHGHGYRQRHGHNGGYQAHRAPVHAPVHAPAPVAYSAPEKHVSPPICDSVPVKTCEKVPVSTPRKVARTVCDTVVDITTIEDCTETVTKHCEQTSTSHSSHSAVVGHETKVLAHAEPAGYAHHPARGHHA